MENIMIKVGGMTCGGCVSAVERVLRGIDGVEQVAVSLEKGEARVDYDAGRVTPDSLRAAIEDAGYDAA